MVVVLATRNPKKIKEIRQILGPEVICETLSNYVDIAIKETGRTLLQNSLAKAEFAYKLSRKPSLADDSGLFVEVLNGEPGIYSARYGKNDDNRIARLLKNLATHKKRRASFKAVFVYYYAPNTYRVFEGECRGKIAYEVRGSDGFGYDPIFIPNGYKKTFAELGQKVKNRLSHRAKALAKFKKYLKKSLE